MMNSNWHNLIIIIYNFRTRKKLQYSIVGTYRIFNDIPLYLKQCRICNYSVFKKKTITLLRNILRNIKIHEQRKIDANFRKDANNNNYIYIFFFNI